MIKSINAKYFVAALVIMLGLGLFPTPPIAQAYYDSCEPYYYPGCYNNPRYYSNPVYVSQPVVYVQQPVVVEKPVIIEKPVYVAPVSVYQNLTVSCGSTSYYSPNNAVVGVTWTANVYGGNGNYSYVWSGSDGLTGNSRTVYYNYTRSGTKYANVTVYSNGQSVSQSCTNTVVFPESYYYSQPVTYQPIVSTPTYVLSSNAAPVNSNKLDIGCYVDPGNSKVNQPVTWNVEVKGGKSPYTYSWTGSDGLTGTLSSIIKYYSTAGNKSAVVTVTSADGQSSSKACSNAVNVTSNYVAPVAKTVAKPVAKVTTTAPVAVAPVETRSQSPVVDLTPANANMTAASLFSLENVPWGWVAILIILVLFFTVIFMLFNKKKI